MRRRILFLVIAYALVFSGCKKSNKDEDRPAPEYYISGKLNGTPFNWEVRIDDGEWWPATSATSGVLYGEGDGSLTASIAKQVDDPRMESMPSIGVRFQTYSITNSTVTESAFNSFINKGTWTYAGSDERIKGLKNLVVEYTDDKGIQYNSIGTQEGSTFNVTSVSTAPAGFGSQESLKITANFNCRVYPKSGTGASLTLSEVQAVLYLENLFSHD